MERLRVPRRPGLIASELPEIYLAQSVKDLLDSRGQAVSGLIARQEGLVNSYPSWLRPVLKLMQLPDRAFSYLSYLISPNREPYQYIPSEVLCWTMIFSAQHNPARDISLNSRTVTLFNDNPPAEIDVQISDLLVAHPPVINGNLMSLDTLRGTTWRLGVRLKNEYKSNSRDRYVLAEVVRLMPVEARGMFLKRFLRRTAETFSDGY